jgi:hypothetical protein
MRNPWNVVLCLLGVHRWRTYSVSGDKGWKCRNCEALVLEREYLERVHDPAATDRPVMSHGGAAGASLPPFE